MDAIGEDDGDTAVVDAVVDIAAAADTAAAGAW